MLSLQELVDQVDKHDNSYYNDFISLISDPEYDGLKDQLRERSIEFFKKENKNKQEKILEARIKDALKRIGAPPPDGAWPKYVHEVPMDSLNKVNTPDELLSTWYKKCNKPSSILLTEKLDGMSISLKYVAGRLLVGSTRGGGAEGENITRNVYKMCNVPFTIPGFDGHVRGEVILLKSKLKQYFPEMANARNGTAISKRSDGEGCEHLTIFAYSVDGKDFSTEEEAYAWLKSVGFNVPNYVVGNIKDFTKLWQKYMDSVRDTLDYDIDGLVGHINNRAERFALGDEGRGPKGSIAFKFEAPEARTVLRNIIWQVGDTGRITPIGEFDPVYLGGAKIEKASLHTVANIKNLKIEIGSIIIVSRRNDVIPYIERVLNE